MNVIMFSLLFQARILWIDEKNLTVCCESGIIGQDLERRVSYQSSHIQITVTYKKGYNSTKKQGRLIEQAWHARAQGPPISPFPYP